MTEEEVVDGLPVLHGSRELQPASPPAGVVTAQAAAVAGASLVAGATAVAVLKGARRRRLLRRGALRLGRRRNGQRLQVLGTRSFLVDVHLVDRR